MSALTLPLALANVYADENRLPLASVDLSLNNFAAYRAETGDTVFLATGASERRDAVYLTDGRGDRIFAAAVERFKRGISWGESEERANRYRLKVPGLIAELKLRVFENSGKMEIFVPTESERLVRHFTPAEHRVVNAQRLTDEPVENFKHVTRIYAYADDYELFAVQALDWGRHLVIGRARWSKSADPYRAFIATSCGRRDPVAIELVRGSRGTLLKTQYGKHPLEGQALTDAAIPELAKTLVGARILQADGAVQTPAELAAALRIEFAPFSRG